MSDRHIPSTPPSDASDEDIILEANHSVDPCRRRNATSSTTHIAVVTQDSQTSEYFDGVDLTNDDDRHHIPPSQPPITYPEVPHGGILLGRHGESPRFFIFLHTLLSNLLPLLCSKKQQRQMYCDQGCGMPLGTQDLASSLLAIHLMLLLLTTAYRGRFHLPFSYYSTNFLFACNTIAGVPSAPPPSIWGTNTSPIFPYCGVCFDLPSPASPLPAPTPPQQRIINRVLEIWNIPSPKPYQVEAISCLCFSTKRRLYLVRKTGDGKSAVVLASATILRGITLVLVPLLGLGCDQVAKAFRLEQRVEAYHLDEHRGLDYITLRDRLLKIRKKRSQSIILFTSPQALKKHSLWHPVFKQLFSRQLFTLLVIDEAHCVERQGRSFHPEFKEGLQEFSKIANSFLDISIVAMSATFRANDQLVLSKILKVTPTNLSWGAMQRRNLEFAVSIQAEVYGPMFQGIKQALDRDPLSKVLLYTNTRATAEDVLLKKSENLLSIITGGGDALTLTGGTGLMMKNWIVNLFGGELKSEAANVRIVLATSAANCGLSSNYCRHAPRLGMPPNLYDLMQEMGRLNRDDQARTPPDKYHIFVSFSLYISLYLRIMKEKQLCERNLQLGELMDVLRFLLLPQNCYHLTLESYFGHPSLIQPRLPCGRLFTCGNRCTYCRKDHHEFSTPFHKSKLVRFLSTKVFLQGPIGVNKMIKLLGNNKKVFFPVGYSSLPQGKIHGLFLQLVAAGIVSLDIATASSLKVGTDRLSSSDVELNWATTNVADESVLACEQPHRWKLMNMIPNT